MEYEVDFMSVKEMARLSDWLEANGHKPEEIIDCIHYIANSNETGAKRNQAPNTPPKAKEPD